MDDYFPLPPFSDQAHSRTDVLRELTLLLRDESKEDQIEVLAVVASLSLLLNGSREMIWDELIAALLEEEEMKERGEMNKITRRISKLLQASIRMNLYIQYEDLVEQVAWITFRIGYLHPSLCTRCFTPFIQSILETARKPFTRESICTLLFDHLQLVYPCTSSEDLFLPPTIHHGKVLALRILSGMGDVLFARLVDLLQLFKRDYLSKGEYIQLIEHITRNKMLDMNLVIDFYKRIYELARRLESNLTGNAHLKSSPSGISKQRILIILSSFFPTNTAMANYIFEELCNKEEKGIRMQAFADYLFCVYTTMNEVSTF